MKEKRGKIIQTANEYEQYLKSIDKDSFVVFDTETMGLSIEAPVIGFSFWDFKQTPVFVPTDNLFKEGIPQYDIVNISNKYFPQLRGAIGHNIKYDLGVTKRMGVVDLKLHADTSSMIHLYNPDLLKKLETRVKQDLGYDKQTYEQIIGKKWNKVNWEKDVADGLITLQNMGMYACEDAEWTGRIYDHYNSLLSFEDWELMRRIENPLLFTLRDMHDEGVNIDTDYLLSMGDDIRKELARIEQRIYEEAGAVFNIGSSKQLAEILYDKLKYPCTRKTKGGGRSTDKYALEDLLESPDEDTIISNLILHSSLDTLRTNFIEAIPAKVNSDGRLRCSFNQDATRTGRLSSNDPNLQNQPNHKKFPVRKAFIPTEGNVLCVADLSQIELRVMAHVSGDKNFSRAFFDGVDIHGAVANDLGIERKQAKTINFGVLYGMGVEKLARSLGVTKERAKQIIFAYNSTYYGYSRWKKATEAFATENLCIYNIFNRIRRLPNARSRDGYLRSQEMRRAVNTVVQGSAADMIKIAMINTHKEFLEKKMTRSKLLLTVHDELVVDTHPNEAEQAYKILIHNMENSVKLTVPVIAEGKIVNTWYDMKDDDFVSLLPKFQRRNTPIYLFN